MVGMALASANAKAYYFHSIKNSTGLVQDQFTRLAIFIYGNDRMKSRIYGSLSNPENTAFRNTAFSKASKNSLPKTLDELYALYVNEPIKQKDREEFLPTFGIPFMSTGKTIYQLYSINPAAFSKTLDALITSKKIQKVQANLFLLARQPPIPLEKNEAFKADVRRLTELYREKYEDQEGIIAASWLEALEEEHDFKASNSLHRLTAKGIEGAKEAKEAKETKETKETKEAKGGKRRKTQRRVKINFVCNK